MRMAAGWQAAWWPAPPPLVPGRYPSVYVHQYDAPHLTGSPTPKVRDIFLTTPKFTLGSRDTFYSHVKNGRWFK